MKYEQLRDRASKRFRVSRDKFDQTFPDKCSKHFLEKLVTFAKRTNGWDTALQQLRLRQATRRAAAKSRVASDDWLPADVPCATDNADTQGDVWDSIYWITVPGTQALEDATTLSIPFFPQDRERLRHNPWLEKALELGSTTSMAEKHNDGSISVHQSLATCLAVEHEQGESFSTRHFGWKWLIERIQEDDLLAYCSNSTMILIQATGDDPDEMEGAYEYVQQLDGTNGTALRIYPCREEWWQETRKAGDIRALDKIANGAYRPATCFGHGIPCMLRNADKTVLKRSRSGSAQHVSLLTREQRGRELTCIPTEAPVGAKGPQRPRKKLGTSSILTQPKYFHQEFVPGLSEGEFKVFIVTEPDPKGLRGLSGRIVAISWVTVSIQEKEKTFASRAVQDVDFERFKCHSVTSEGLQAFALDTFDKLRRLDSRAFESLEVGARLDIGVADNNDGKGGKGFFVNEITRWYNAHYFSFTTCADPKTQLCGAFARSFTRAIKAGMSA